MRKDRQGLRLIQGLRHASIEPPPLSQTAGLCEAQLHQPCERVVGYLHQVFGEMLRLSQSRGRGVERDFDLTAALRAVQAAYERIGSMHVTLALQPAAIDVLTQMEAREILQIVREALGYALRKTLATRATVSIRKRGARICLRIWDDGDGFKLIDGQKRNEGLALIEARVRKIGGTVRAQVGVGKGAQLLVEFSLEPILVPV